MTENSRSGGPWLWGIVITIGLFLIWLVVFVLFSFTQDVNLVEDRYYEKDRNYEQHMQRLTLTEALSEKPRILFQDATHTLEVHFPQRFMSEDLSGTIEVYRPSDGQIDRHFAVSPNRDSMQVLSLGGLQTGLWRVKLSWDSDGFGYYLEDSFIVP